VNPDSKMKRFTYSGILNLRHWLGNSEGMVLVLTLMILTLITAMVVEFAYGVYTSTSALYNWRDSQRLSFVAKSGVAMAVNTISGALRSNSGAPPSELYRYLGREIPVPNIPEGFNGSFVIKAEDENARLNLNSLRNADSLQVFKRLLGNLGLDELIAERVADWIDTDSEPKLRDSEEGAKNAFMDSVDELLLIKGIDRHTYEKLSPYVTVYGFGGTDDRRININTAAIPVIMSLNENGMITREMAERLVRSRELEPFNSTSEVTRAGIEENMLLGNFVTAYPPVNFRITSVSEENKIKRVIEGVVKVTGGSQGTIFYWREM